MSISDAGAWTNTLPQSAAVDPRAAMSLVNSLMPLLLQIQVRSREHVPSAEPWRPTVAQQPGFAQPGPGQFGFDPLGLGPLGPFAPPNPMVDHQAAANMAENLAADSLRTLSAYLEAQVGQRQGLNACVPIVIRAANCFAGRDYAQCLGLIWEAYRTIAALRMIDMQLSPPRAASLVDASAATSAQISH